MEIEQKLKEKPKEKMGERLVRIMSTDIPGNIGLYPGLARIKGVSWSLSNAVCIKLKMDKKKKIGALTEEEIRKISEFIKNPNIPIFLFNRRKDFDTGEDKHLVTNDLDLKKEFDIKRLKKIKSYRGIRHAAKQPLRGQRTRSHFRTNKGKAAGGKKVRKIKK